MTAGFFVFYEIIYFGDGSTSQKEIVANSNFFFVFFLTILIIILPYITYRTWRFHFSTDIISNLRVTSYETNYMIKMYKKQLEHYSYMLRSVRKFRKMFKGNLKLDPLNQNVADQKLKYMYDLYMINNKKEEDKFNMNEAEPENSRRSNSEPNIDSKHRPRTPKHLKVKFDNLKRKQMEDDLGEISEEPSIIESKHDQTIIQANNEMINIVDEMPKVNRDLHSKLSKDLVKLSDAIKKMGVKPKIENSFKRVSQNQEPRNNEAKSPYYKASKIDNVEIENFDITDRSKSSNRNLMSSEEGNVEEIQ